MSNKERMEAMEKEMVHSVMARVALEKRVSVLEGIVFSREQPDDVFNEGLEAPKPKPIDWSQVADCVPVKLWDDGANRDEWFTYPKLGRALVDAPYWDHESLITGIDIAWHGGECPLPDGVIVEFLTRGKRAYREHDAQEVEWRHHEGVVNEVFDVISFRVTGIADGWTEEVGE